MDKTAFELPESTTQEIIEKISELSWKIRNDWGEPRAECRKIVALCDELKEKVSLIEVQNEGLLKSLELLKSK